MCYFALQSSLHLCSLLFIHLDHAELLRLHGIVLTEPFAKLVEDLGQEFNFVSLAYENFSGDMRDLKSFSLQLLESKKVIEITVNTHTGYMLDHYKTKSKLLSVPKDPTISNQLKMAQNKFLNLNETKRIKIHLPTKMCINEDIIGKKCLYNKATTRFKHNKTDLPDATTGETKIMRQSAVFLFQDVEPRNILKDGEEYIDFNSAFNDISISDDEREGMSD